MKNIVGIIPSTLGLNSINLFDYKYYVQKTYIDRIKKSNGIPIIIPPTNNKLDKNILKLCNSFLIIGGKYIHRYHFEIIDYAIKNNKKLLGICMGMQAIAMYSNNDLKEKTLYKVKGHYNDNITKNNELLIHKVKINNNSLLSKILGTEINTNSVHNYAIKKVSSPFKIVGESNEIIEAIEYKNVIGVQFHPELMNGTDKLFKWLSS